MKKVFIVTGSTGFLGNTIVKKLSKNKDYEVRALVYSKKERRYIKRYRLQNISWRYNK